MSFNATAPAPETEAPIGNADFFPTIDPAHCRDTIRLDGTVTAPRLREALVDAMAWANSELAAWAETQIAAGHAGLEDVPAPHIDGESIKLAKYRRAVYCYAASNLGERYRSYDATGAAMTSGASGQKQDANTATISDLRRDAAWAIRDSQGLARSVVELI